MFVSLQPSLFFALSGCGKQGRCTPLCTLVSRRIFRQETLHRLGTSCIASFRFSHLRRRRSIQGICSFGGSYVDYLERPFRFEIICHALVSKASPACQEVALLISSSLDRISECILDFIRKVEYPSLPRIIDSFDILDPSGPVICFYYPSVLFCHIPICLSFAYIDSHFASNGIGRVISYPSRIGVS